MNNNIEEFREGIFSLHTRRFGTVAELMIEKLFDMKDSDVLNFDKKKDNLRVEVKFSRALKENESKITKTNLISQCIAGSSSKRAFNATEVKLNKFDCNIQQIKNKEFDILYYGIFFKDHIEIYKIINTQISELSNYSDKQHRGNTGEGQFHLNNTNIDFHRKNFLIKIITYEELYKLFEVIK